MMNTGYSVPMNTWLSDTHSQEYKDTKHENEGKAIDTMPARERSSILTSNGAEHHMSYNVVLIINLIRKIMEPLSLQIYVGNI